MLLIAVIISSFLSLGKFSKFCLYDQFPDLISISWVVHSAPATGTNSFIILSLYASALRQATLEGSIISCIVSLLSFPYVSFTCCSIEDGIFFTASTHTKETQSFQGTGTIGIDHNVVVAKVLILFIKSLFHNADASIAVQIKNQLIATHITLQINFHIPTQNHAISISINHQSIFVVSAIIFSAFTVLIILTNTVDILTAKQTIAGEIIIPTKLLIVKFSSMLPFLNTLSSSLNALNKTITGDNIIAIQITQILMKNTTNIANNGIHTANT
jgi:hypothetical protein